MNKSLKEIQQTIDNQTKILEEINKALKESKHKQTIEKINKALKKKPRKNKQMNEMNKTIQDLKLELEAENKVQTKLILEIENLGK